MQGFAYKFICFHKKLRREGSGLTTYEQSLREDIKELRDDVRELRKELHRYKGFIGGVMWAVGVLGAGFGFLLSLFKQGFIHAFR